MKDSFDKNNIRFTLLPLFNILTQIGCFFIYLYVYPETFPEYPKLDPLAFTLFSAVYIAVNILFCALFNNLRKQDSQPDYNKRSHILLLAFLLFYIVFESVETIMEVEISSNIYRFLATFFMVTILPVQHRAENAPALFFSRFA